MKEIKKLRRRVTVPQIAKGVEHVNQTGASDDLSLTINAVVETAEVMELCDRDASIPSFRDFSADAPRARESSLGDNTKVRKVSSTYETSQEIA